jgi:hypothetical protein
VISFDKATETLEAEFGPHGLPEGAKAETTIIVCSGGTIEKPDDTPPALCLTEDTALEVWLASAQKALRGFDHPIRWQILDGPHLDKWFITVEDSKNTQRLADKRYSVVATIGVSRRT